MWKHKNTDWAVQWDAWKERNWRWRRSKESIHSCTWSCRPCGWSSSWQQGFFCSYREGSSFYLSMVYVYYLIWRIIMANSWWWCQTKRSFVKCLFIWSESNVKIYNLIKDNYLIHNIKEHALESKVDVQGKMVLLLVHDQNLAGYWHLPC